MNTVRLETIEISDGALLNGNLSSNGQVNGLGNETIENRSNKYRLDTFLDKIKKFFKQFQFVLQSIGPDLKSLTYWQITILILYAIFNFTFSILVIFLFQLS